MGQFEVILVDTHVVLWLALDHRRISVKARAAIDHARKEAKGLAISDITLFELATMVRKGRIRIATTLQDFLAETEKRFVVLPITAATSAQSVELPSSYPKDPADRIIGATALVSGLPLVTADSEIQRSGALQTIW